MSTAVGTEQYFTLTDYAKLLKPDGGIANVVDVLRQSNPILDDMIFSECNDGTTHQATVQVGYPTSYWRLFNQGTQPSNGKTAQVKFSCGMCENWSVVDAKLAELNGNVAAFRYAKSKPHLRSLANEIASTIFYGNDGTNPEEFNGLSNMYSSSTAANGQNILKAGGAGSDNASIWLICWAEDLIHGLFPKGSKAGISQEDEGKVTQQTTDGNGVSSGLIKVYRERFGWELGLAVTNWKYAARIPNIDMSALVSKTAAPDLAELMYKAIFHIEDLNAGKTIFYMNRTVAEFLGVQKRDDIQTGGQLTTSEWEGKRVLSFQGIPVHTCDALLTETESLVV